jgi:hypothetical protein
MVKFHTTPRHAEAIEIASHLVEAIRLLTKTFPEDEDMVMVPEMRSSVMDLHKAAFMAAHVDNRDDFLAYTDDVRGKAARLSIQLDMCKDLGYMGEEEHATLTADIEKIAGLVEPPPKPKLTLVE